MLIKIFAIDEKNIAIFLFWYKIIRYFATASCSQPYIPEMRLRLLSLILGELLDDNTSSYIGKKAGICLFFFIWSL